MKLLRLIGILGVGVLVLQSTTAIALQLAENDDAFDAAGYNGAIEDSLEVLPLNDFYPPITLDWTFSFDIDVEDGGPFQDDEVSVDTDLSVEYETNYTEEEQFQKKSSENPLPRASIQLSTTSVEPGAELVATGQAQNFNTGGSTEDLFFGWALNNVALNGVAAGADPLDLPQASSPAGLHTRTPSVDNDQDGMDDNWEKRYGLDPSNPADAGQDLDGDGYTNDVYANELGEVLILEPETSAGLPGGAFTNYKEYIWGTDPTNPDTDGDGFTDGQDVAGLGQVTIPLIIPDTAQPGDQYDLRLTILGESLQQFDKEHNLVKVDSTSVNLIVSDGEQVEASLSVDDDHPAPGQTIELVVDLGQTEYHRGTYDYTWYVNNVEDPGSGESNYVLNYEIPTSTQAGDIISFAVIARNYDTGGEASAELDVRVGEVIQLEYEADEVIPGQPLTVRATLHSNTIPEENLVFHWSKDGREVLEQSGPGKSSYTQEIEETSGEEIGLRVRVTTSDDSKTIGEAEADILVTEPYVEIVAEKTVIAPGEAVLAVAVPHNFGSPDLVYSWKIDGETQSIPADQDVLTVIGGQDGDRTQLAVTVTTQEPVPQTASAIEVFTTSAEGGFSANTSSVNLIAGLFSSGFRVPLLLGIIGATAAGLLGIVIIVRRRNGS